MFINAVLAAGTSVWVGFEHGVGIAVIAALAWIIWLAVFWKLPVALPLALGVTGVLLATMIAVNVFVKKSTTDTVMNENTNTVTETTDTEAATASEDLPLELPDGVILVQGEDGVLGNKGSYSYIGESARGGEAYLGDGGATATYAVDAPAAGAYTLSIRAIDDGIFENGDRSVTVTLGQQSLQYLHVSEDTHGWKWFTLGTIRLAAGENAIVFTKDADTYAAFTMDAFKLVPTE